MVAKNITVNGRLYALVPAKTPVVASPAPRFVCITAGCYKEGHSFSANGALGANRADGTHVKGHFELNPSHNFKTI